MTRVNGTIEKIIFRNEDNDVQHHSSRNLYLYNIEHKRR